MTGGLAAGKRSWQMWFLSLAIVASILLIGAWTRWMLLEQLSTAGLGFVVLLMVTVPWLRHRFRAELPVSVSPLAWLFVAMAVFGLASFAVSVHRGATLQELLKLMGLLGLFVFALTYAGSEDRLHRLSWVLFGASVLAMILAIVLYILSPRITTGPVASLIHALVIREAGGRLSAFFSYSNALAGFLILPICIGIAQFAFGLRVRERLLGLTGTIILMSALVLTESRGGMITVAGALVLLPIVGWLSKCISSRQMAHVAVAYGVVAVIVVASIAVPVSRNLVWKPLVQRFLAVLEEVSQGQATKGTQLGGRLQMFRDLGPYLRAYPVLGSGLGTYASVYMKFRSQLFFAADPHSLVVKSLAEGGVLGFAVELISVVVLLWLGLRSARRSNNKALTLAVVVGIAATLVHSCFDIDSMFYVFCVVPAILLGSCTRIAMQAEASFWVLGRPVRKTSGPAPVSKHAKNLPVRSHSWLGAAGLVSLGLTAVVFVLVMSAEALFVAGLRRAPASMKTWNVPREFAVSQKLNPLDARYPLQAAAASRSIMKIVPSALAVTYRDQAGEAYRRAVSLDRLNSAIQIQYGQFLYEVGDRDAVDVFELLTTLDPIDPGTWTSLAYAHLTFNHNPTLAEQALSQARRLDPAYYDIANVIGQIALDRGDTTAAEAAFRQSVKTKPSQQLGWSGLVDVCRTSGTPGKLVAALFDATRSAQNPAVFVTELEALAPAVQWFSPAAGATVVPGGNVVLTWNVTGATKELEWQTIWAAPIKGDWLLVADNVQPSIRSLTWQVPATTPPGACRFYVYLRAPRLMAGSDRGWAFYVVSPPVQVER
ncbi:MAG: O-antigen ligase family protein [Candidatus Cryosericum sp.]